MQRSLTFIVVMLALLTPAKASAQELPQIVEDSAFHIPLWVWVILAGLLIVLIVVAWKAYKWSTLNQYLSDENYRYEMIREDDRRAHVDQIRGWSASNRCLDTLLQEEKALTTTLRVQMMRLHETIDALVVALSTPPPEPTVQYIILITDEGDVCALLEVLNQSLEEQSLHEGFKEGINV